MLVYREVQKNSYYANYKAMPCKETLIILISVYKQRSRENQNKHVFNENVEFYENYKALKLLQKKESFYKLHS